MFRIKGRLSLGERGDTIVEVMIVLAVLGMAIGISYATANRSLLNARQGQENSQAAVLAQSQIEQLRTLTTSNCTPPSVDSSHCIYSGSPYGAVTAPFCLVNGAVENAKTDSGCTGAGENSRYAVAITRDDTTDTFTVVATWDDVLGEGKDTVTLSYRLPQPPPPSPPPAPVGESLTFPPTRRSTTYGALCHLPDNRGSRVYYYSLTGVSCAGGGTFDYNNPTADRARYNIACRFPDGRYAYTQATASLYCLSGSALVAKP